MIYIERRSIDFYDNSDLLEILVRPKIYAMLGQKAKESAQILVDNKEHNLFTDTKI